MSFKRAGDMCYEEMTDEQRLCLAELVRWGLVHIRYLAGEAGADSLKQIWTLADAIHELPGLMVQGRRFNQDICLSILEGLQGKVQPDSFVRRYLEGFRAAFPDASSARFEKEMERFMRPAESHDQEP